MNEMKPMWQETWQPTGRFWLDVVDLLAVNLGAVRRWYPASARSGAWVAETDDALAERACAKDASSELRLRLAAHVPALALEQVDIATMAPGAVTIALRAAPWQIAEAATWVDNNLPVGWAARVRSAPCE
jgi:hypothetical protein